MSNYEVSSNSELNILNKQYTALGRESAGRVSIPIFNQNWDMSYIRGIESPSLYSECSNQKAQYDRMLHSSTNLSIAEQNKIQTSKVYSEIIRESKNYPYKTLDEFMASKDGVIVIDNAIRNNLKISATEEELIKLAGGPQSISTTKPKPSNCFCEVFEVKTKNGMTGYVEIQTKSAVPLKRSAYEDLLYKKQMNIKNMISANINQYASIEKELQGYTATFKPNDKGLVKQAGLHRDKFGRIVNLEENVTAFRTELSSMNNDKKLLESLKLTNTIKGTTFGAEVDALIKKYGVNTPKEAYELLNARIALVNQYDSGLKTIIGKMDTLLVKNPAVAQLPGKAEKLKKYSPKTKTLKDISKNVGSKLKEFVKIPGIGKALALTGAALAAGYALFQTTQQDLKMC